MWRMMIRQVNVLMLLLVMSEVSCFVAPSDTTRIRPSTTTTTSSCRGDHRRRLLVLWQESSTTDDESSSSTSNAAADKDVVDTSTMTLLEHVNLNVPSHEYIVPFYFDVLGLGLDPRKAANLDYETTGKKTLWANCGASQFHLPYGERAQQIPGHVGLLYPDAASLQRLEQRLQANRTAFASYEKSVDPRSSGQNVLSVVDKYGNQFKCRVGASGVPEAWQQPVIGTTDADKATWGDAVVHRFGKDTAECVGLSYVEFNCPPGTADKISLFYDSVFDATTSVVQDTTGPVAIIGFGNITSQGRSDQALLFRETARSTIPPYDGHHVAMYVGQSAEDFAQAFKNAQLAGVVWKNPRFADQVDTLALAAQWNQFRFKDIVDMDTGETIFTLEHEIRSVAHESWPGAKLS